MEYTPDSMKAALQETDLKPEEIDEFVKWAFISKYEGDDNPHRLIYEHAGLFVEFVLDDWTSGSTPLALSEAWELIRKGVTPPGYTRIDTMDGGKVYVSKDASMLSMPKV